MRYPPLEGGKITPQHTSIHMPCRWDIPHSEATTRFLRCWDFHHLKKCIYVPLMGFLPLRDINTDMSTGVFSIVYGNRNPLLWDSPTKSPPLCYRDFPLSKPHLMLHRWDFAHSGHKHQRTSSPRPNLRADEYIHPSIFHRWNFPLGKQL